MPSLLVVIVSDRPSLELFNACGRAYGFTSAPAKIAGRVWIKSQLAGHFHQAPGSATDTGMTQEKKGVTTNGGGDQGKGVT
ncbi:hypothetical protein ACXYTJ_11545 [Gilvimarinus sp. F26214L]|uniref:hypothetical protein n=1 Tax=Gilvimarinus sp. DZF01 TaxID=3461371 RepID=UPI00404661FB